MTRVINIGTQAISLDRITINPKDSHTWLNSEVSFSLRRKIIRLMSMGLIQVEESPDISVTLPIENNEPEEIKEEPIIEEVETEEVKPEIKETSKPKRKNTRKKSQRKEE